MDALTSRQRTSGRWVPLGILAVLAIARTVFLFRCPVDSDEPQHLHVIYQWMHGRIPYLDFFDNHTPLFAWLFQPFAAAAGERPDIVLWARLAGLPIGLGVLGVLYALCRRLGGEAVALWTLALTMALSDWSLKALEFRPDVLWAGLFFLALLPLTGREGAAGWKAFFLGGLALGAALAASVKTSFLMLGLGMGWGVAWMLFKGMRAEFTAGRIALCACAGAAGFAVVPGCFLAWFGAHGALPGMSFCLVEVNQPEPPGVRMLWFFAGAPLAVFLGSMLGREGWIRPAVFLSAAFYALLLLGFSPSLKKQTFLPAYPLLIFGGVALWDRRRPGGNAVPAGLCAVLFAHQLAEAAPWRDGFRSQRALLEEVLSATRPGEKVLDLKGETIFRPRPVYLAYVLATARGIESGRLDDADPASLSDTAFAVADGTGFSAPIRKAMKDFYVPAGNGTLRVAGQLLKPSWEGGRWVARAAVPVAGAYLAIEAGREPEEVRVDRPGEQAFDFGSSRAVRLLYWKAAWDRGLRPRFEEIRELRAKESPL